MKTKCSFMVLAIFLSACVKPAVYYDIRTQPEGAKCQKYESFGANEIDNSKSIVTPGILRARPYSEILCKKDGYRSHKFPRQHSTAAKKQSETFNTHYLQADLIPLKDGCSDNYRHDPIKGLMPIGNKGSFYVLDETLGLNEPSQKLEEVTRKALIGQTVLSYTTSFGYQITYYNEDGKSYLWFPENNRIVLENWRLSDGKICFDYLNVRSPLKSKCTHSVMITQSIRGRLHGDVLNLSQSINVPYMRKRTDPTEYFSSEIKKYSKPECGFPNKPFNDEKAMNFVNSIAKSEKRK